VLGDNNLFNRQAEGGKKEKKDVMGSEGGSTSSRGRKGLSLSGKASGAKEKRTNLEGGAKQRGTSGKKAGKSRRAHTAHKENRKAVRETRGPPASERKGLMAGFPPQKETSSGTKGRPLRDVSETGHAG